MTTNREEVRWKKEKITSPISYNQQSMIAVNKQSQWKGNQTFLENTIHTTKLLVAIFCILAMGYCWVKAALQSKSGFWCSFVDLFSNNPWYSWSSDIPRNWAGFWQYVEPSIWKEAPFTISFMRTVHANPHFTVNHWCLQRFSIGCKNPFQQTTSSLIIRATVWIDQNTFKYCHRIRSQFFLETSLCPYQLICFQYL